MVARMIDVLSDQEKVLERRVFAAKELLASVNQRVADARKEHEKICKNVAKDKKARDILTKELKALNEIKVNYNMRANPDLAKEEYKVRKPDRYDVQVMRVYHHGENRNIFYVKMYWGNVCRMIYEGPDGDMARDIARKIACLTGQDTVHNLKVASKKDLCTT